MHGVVRIRLLSAGDARSTATICICPLIAITQNDPRCEVAAVMVVNVSMYTLRLRLYSWHRYKSLTWPAMVPVSSSWRLVMPPNPK